MMKPQSLLQQMQLSSRRMYATVLATPIYKSTLPPLPPLGQRSQLRHEYPVPEPDEAELERVREAEQKAFERLQAKSGPPSVAVLPPLAVLTTLHSFPSLEPTGVSLAPANVLDLPFRRDILWAAVVYENDKASNRSSIFVRNRAELGYSRKKLFAQKGRGRARIGSAGSPMLKGGGKPFGPRHPDPSTKLLRRTWNLAMRTAFSYFYHRHLFTVLEKTAEISTGQSRAIAPVWKEVGLQGKKVLIIVSEERPNLSKALAGYGKKYTVINVKDLDVRTVLKAKHILIEKEAFDYLAEKTQGKEYLDDLKKVSQIKRKQRRLRFHFANYKTKRI
ncbi:ribosomal protein L4 domain-containing protein [Myxozyma melibiosi]|uniref:Large ribosomal subunit protein uL4m n=1 Tax=Myxozyma melibiosi TaxID=54550 RepID=A0ABR1F619_9ASCO